MSLNLIYGYTSARDKVASYYHLNLAKGKSLLRTVRAWTAGTTEEEAIPLKGVN